MFKLISDINISLSYKVIKSFYNKRFFVNRQADNCPEKFPLDSTQALYTGWQWILMYVIHFFCQYVIDSQSFFYSCLIIIQQYPGQNILCVMIFFLVFIICIFFASPPLCNDAYLCHMRKYFHYAIRYQFSNLYIQKWCKFFFDLGIIKSINLLRLFF